MNVVDSVSSCLLLPVVFPDCSAVPCVLDELSDVSVEEIDELDVLFVSLFELFVASPLELFDDSPTVVKYPAVRLACATPSARLDCFSLVDDELVFDPVEVVLFVPDDDVLLVSDDVVSLVPDDVVSLVPVDDVLLDSDDVVSLVPDDVVSLVPDDDDD